MGYYKNCFDSLPCFQDELTVEQVKRIISCCVYFETKDKHPAALNTPMLGVTMIYFTDVDVAMLYQIFNVDEFSLLKIVQESEYTQASWVIVNDPYNHLVIYLIHRCLTSRKLDKDLAYEGAMSLLKLLHYKFFTSLVYNSYKYGADEDVMTYVVNNLNKKYDISKAETWKQLIESRCTDLLTPGSLHYKTFAEYQDDVGIIYALSDSQSNLRQKIVRINCLYYDAKAQKEAIGSYTTLDTLDGEKIICSTSDTFSGMTTGMLLQIQSPSRLLDMELLDVISSKYKEVSSETLRMVLTRFCELTAQQSSNTKFKSVVQVKDKETGEKKDIYVSCKLLLTEFLQKTYRYCIQSGDVNMSSKKAILIKVLNIYTSSRINDPDILTIKRSFQHFVLDCAISRRPATNAALTTCMLIYLLIRSFDYI